LYDCGETDESGSDKSSADFSGETSDELAGKESGELDMETPIENKQPQDSKEDTNVELIYTYTENLLKNRIESMVQLNTRLGTFIGFGGLVLKFSADLPASEFEIIVFGIHINICLALKVISCLCAVASICCSALGLTGKERGKVVSPDELMDEWFDEPEILCRCLIINTWRPTIEEFRLLLLEKTKRLNLAIYLLTISIVAFGFDIAIASYFR
jgi:hypothetical protein